MEIARVSTEALTRRDHTTIMRTRRRPITDPPIQRHKPDIWVASTDEAVFGFHITKADK
jgi:hypothetical protein